MGTRDGTIRLRSNRVFRDDGAWRDSLYCRSLVFAERSPIFLLSCHLAFHGHRGQPVSLHCNRDFCGLAMVGPMLEIPLL